ncbi:hypothetical protein C8R46DRAFT_1114906 [Mycena filopes]|nr:hypothetical protein C8R46DRAFT_1114906 [Mycena filopes]
MFTSATSAVYFWSLDACNCDTIRSLISFRIPSRFYRVTPILYRSFLVCSSTQVDDGLPLRRIPKEFRQMALSSPATVTAHIRDLWITVYIWVDSTQLGKFLSACSTIETLGIFGNSPLVPGILPALARLPLHRLSLHLPSLFRGLPGLNNVNVPGPDDFKVDFTHTPCSRASRI